MQTRVTSIDGSRYAELYPIVDSEGTPGYALRLARKDNPDLPGLATCRIDREGGMIYTTVYLTPEGLRAISNLALSVLGEEDFRLAT